MMEAVHRYEGTVNQVMGDGIMALFGAPLAHEDHAVRACYAALRMQESIKGYAEELFRSQGATVQIRVGLNSGEVVVRAIGNDLHVDYTAVGQTTHLAARMEQLASPGTILLTAETLALVEGYMTIRSRGRVPVKGVPDPIEVYELTGGGGARTRLQAAAVRGLTRFVGRDAELEQLRRALDRAAGGHGHVVAVVGEAGVGKSRLFYEFTHSHRTQGWLLLQSGSVSYGKATAYLAVIDLLHAYFQIEGRDDGRKIREKVSGKLVTLDQTLMPALPSFLALLDVPVDDVAWQALDPPQRRQRTLEAIKRLLLREAQVQPLVLVFEDLHWIDSETQAVLDGLVENLPTARFLLLVNYRPEYEHGWTKKTYYTQLRIDPLAPASAEELLRALLGDAAELQPLRHLLIERTEGNPFFLEEGVRTLVETRALVGERGAYRLATPVTSIQVPATVQAVLAARIDRLSPEDKRLLQTAAVIGTDVPFALLRAITDASEEELRAGLERLRAAEFVYEASLFPDLEYTFKHALTHEVAYGSLLQERRRALHARIVEAIEGLYPHRLGEHVERLASHACRGEVWSKALAYSHEAGRKAAGRSSYREAAICYEHALAALHHLPQSRELTEQAIDVRLDLRHALYPVGEPTRIEEHLREAERLAESIDDQRRLVTVRALRINAYLIAGDPERAIESGLRALTVAEALDDTALRVTANFYLGLAYHVVGDYRQAIALSRTNLDLLMGDRIGERFGFLALPSVASRAWLALSLAEIGEFPQGIAVGEEALKIAEELNHPFSLGTAYAGIGYVYLVKGELDRAIAILEGGLTYCHTWNILRLEVIIAAELAHAYALSGRVEGSLTFLEKARAQAEAIGHFRLALILAWISHAYLRSGRRDDASRVIARAQQLAGKQKERGHQAWIQWVMGEIASDRDPLEPEEVELSYRGAMNLATELGMRPLVAHCHLGLGKLYRRTGENQEAQKHVTTAMAMYREMDMGFWREKAEAEAERTG